MFSCGISLLDLFAWFGLIFCGLLCVVCVGLPRLV